ncbi:MAG: PTS transporter subunit EIIC [Candidatus Nanopelagicales bacterium]
MSASAAASAANKGGGGQSLFAILQRVGKSLMLPIAVLPAAGLLLRLGQGDLLGGIGETAPDLGDGPFSILSKAGGAIFDNLAMLFALGVAIGFAKKSDGSTALAGLVGYLVFKNVLTFQAFDTDPSADVAKAPDPGVFGGIVMGITAAVLWQKYHRTKLPAALAFFSGRRLVPMLAAVAGIIWGIAFGFVWPPIGNVLNNMAEWMYDNGPIGAGIYGVVNRMLIPTGLHHIINSFVWFQAGECQNTAGAVFHGDLTCFFNSKGTPDHSKYGLFMTGFFPIMMFALPAAAFAMVAEAKDKVAASILPAAALTAFLTGVTEPLEFSFMFVAPLLYGFHAVMTGVSMAVSYWLGARMGFGFSAGFMDFALNWGLGTKPWLIILIGLVFGAIYYVVFRALIRAKDLKTPGREDDAALEDAGMIA